MTTPSSARRAAAGTVGPMDVFSAPAVVAADRIAADAHAGQFDKGGVDYIEHPRAVARLALWLLEQSGAPFDAEVIAVAALLHDTTEDTPLTSEDLLAAGVDPAAVVIVDGMSRPDGMPYGEFIRTSVAVDRATSLNKLADNIHNSLPERSSSSNDRLRARYRDARDMLVPVVFPGGVPDDVAEVLATLNL